MITAEIEFENGGLHRTFTCEESLVSFVRHELPKLLGKNVVRVSFMRSKDTSASDLNRLWHECSGNKLTRKEFENLKKAAKEVPEACEPELEV